MLGNAEIGSRSSEWTANTGSSTWNRGASLAPVRAPHPGVRWDADEEIVVRSARVADMQKVESLINRYADEGLMLRKTLEQLCRNFREFVVAVNAEGRVVGCGALRVYTPQLAEVASLAVDETVHRGGIGRRLVEQLAVEAQNLGIGTIFALTLKGGFFHRLGFRTVPKELFPLKVWADCRSCPKLHACDEIAVVKELGDR
jgi:amino-acid N-acetyltransferase